MGIDPETRRRAAARQTETLADLMARGQTVGEVCRHIGVSEKSYYR
jgi:hypothetical protein